MELAPSLHETADPGHGAAVQPRDPEPCARIEIPDDALCAVQRHYDEGLLLEAHRRGQVLGDYRRWSGCRALVLAGRLVSHLGAAKLGSALFTVAWRSQRSDPEATYFHALDRFHRRGPYSARSFLRKYGDLRQVTSADTLSSWQALHAEVAATLRDFDAADAWIVRAEQTAPDNPWVQVCRAFVLEQEDRCEAALEACQQALEMRPGYRPGVQGAARLLSLLGRDDEALALLADAANRFQHSGIVGHLHSLQMELKQYEAALTSLGRYDELTPLKEAPIQQWIAAQQSEIAYHRGDVEAAIAHAKRSQLEYFLEIARRLEDPARAGAARVLLPVGFVRQHHMTCGPATLAAIGQYWKMPVDHLQVAEEICYDGTPHYSERKWAEDNGWAAREFSVTEAAATQLIERGIPFTLTTAEPASSHLQAVIGYDGRRGTLIIRDPYERLSREGLADKVVQRYEMYGPRGMALVPLARRSLLDEIELPDAELWDLLHEVDGALQAHQRWQAQQLVERMQTKAPDHRLTLQARRNLAYYDGNPAEQLAAAEILRAQYPDNQRLELERLSLLKDQIERDDLLAQYRWLCDRADSHPVVWQQYARELQHDARRHDDVIWMLKRALRRWPRDASTYHLLAGAHWSERRFDDALDLYRLAAALEDKNESLCASYFLASIDVKRTSEALAFLHGRLERFGRKSSGPAQTLAHALQRIERTGEALAVLDRAVELRPEDGDLLLYAADTYASASADHIPRARELLAQAKPKCSPTAWLRTAARISAAEGQRTQALEHWHELAELQPLAIDVHRGLARMLAESEGMAAALAHLEAAANRFPHHQPLLELWAEWTRQEPEGVRETVIRRLLAVNSDHAWACRELALLLAHRQEFAEAQCWSETSLRIEPFNPSSLDVHAYVLKLQGKIDQVREYLRRTIHLSVDADYAVTTLLELSPTLEDRREVLQLVKQELERQVIYGDGLLHFRNHARGVVDEAELLALLREAHAARPDLWHAWSALIHQLRDMHQLDEAAAVARQATERFPFLPRLWLDRAYVERACNDAAAERSSLETAWRINPHWIGTIRELCHFYERSGDFAEARQLLERAIAQNPLESGLHADLAEALWRTEEKQAAIDQVRKAVKLDPGDQHGWDCLNHWARQLGCRHKALAAVRELVSTRPGEPRSWLLLARLLDEPGEVEERLDACRRAVALNPWNTEAYDQQAQALEAAGRHEEAIEACRPEVFGERVPSMLRGRHAWIEANRGNLKTAIELARAVVRDDPGFYGAWEKLCDWSRQARDNQSYLEAAGALVRIAPHYEVPYGFLAEAKLIDGDRGAAKAALSRSLEINPSYEFGGNLLFDLQFEDGNLDQARETVATMLRHSQSPLVLARSAILAAREERLQAAVETLQRLCVMPTETAWTVSGPVQELVNSGFQRAALQTLAEALKDAAALPEVGAQWGALSAAEAKRVTADQFAALLERGPIGDQAIYHYLDRLVNDNQARQVERFAKTAGPALRKHLWGWASIGAALVRLRRYDLALKWNRNWRDYPQAQDWMLAGVVESLRAAGYEREAAEASHIALSQPDTGAHRLHRIWLAADAALKEDAASAAQYLAEYDGENPSDHHLFAKNIAECCVKMLTAAPEDRAAAFRSVRHRLSAARRSLVAFDSEPARKRLYYRAVALVARRCGTFWARLWGWCRWLDLRVA